MAGRTGLFSCLSARAITEVQCGRAFVEDRPHHRSGERGNPPTKRGLFFVLSKGSSFSRSGRAFPPHSPPANYLLYPGYLPCVEVICDGDRERLSTECCGICTLDITSMKASMDLLRPFRVSDARRMPEW